MSLFRVIIVPGTAECCQEKYCTFQRVFRVRGTRLADSVDFELCYKIFCSEYTSGFVHAPEESEAIFDRSMRKESIVE